MNGIHWGYEEEIRLTEYLINRVCAKATGRSEPECLHNYPRDVYFIGNLRPRNDGLTVTGHPLNMQELLNKMSPVAFGVEFLIQTRDAIEISTTVRWNCYYRIFPTLEQQRQHQRVQMPQEASTTETNSNKDSSSGDDREAEEIPSVADVEANSSLRDRRSNRISRDSLFVRFNKISCEATGEIVIRRHQNGWGADIDDLRYALEQETLRAQSLIQNDANRMRTNVNVNEKLQIPITALESEERYDVFRQTLQNEIIPEWRWDIRCDIRA